jgi:hypothetical protein
MEPSQTVLSCIQKGAIMSDSCMNEYVYNFGEFLKSKYHNAHWSQYLLCAYEQDSNIIHCFEPGGCYNNATSFLENGSGIYIEIIDYIVEDETIKFTIKTNILKNKNGVVETNKKIFECVFDEEDFNKKISDEITKENGKFYEYLETVDTTAL